MQLQETNRTVEQIGVLLFERKENYSWYFAYDVETVESCKKGSKGEMYIQGRTWAKVVYLDNCLDSFIMDIVSISTHKERCFSSFRSI